MILNSDDSNPRENFPASITDSEFNNLLHLGAVVDARAGGLVIADPATPVRVIFKLGDQYVIEGFIEPRSFVVNWEATAHNLTRLRQIASGATVREVIPPAGDPEDEVFEIILAAAIPHNKLIWVSWGQTVIGPEATARHGDELLTMNRSVNPYRSCDLHEALSLTPGTRDGIV